MATHNDAVCVHCDAELTPRDQSEGWCDSCGKRLPGGLRPPAATGSETPATPAAGGGKWPLMVGAAVVALLGVAAAFAAAG
jgi:hypothetical protein